MSLGQAPEATSSSTHTPPGPCVGDGCPPACPSNPPTGAILAVGESCSGGCGGSGNCDGGCGDGGGAATAAATTATTKETEQQGTEGEGSKCIVLIIIIFILFAIRQQTGNVYGKDRKLLRNSWTLRMLMTGLT